MTLLKRLRLQTEATKKLFAVLIDPDHYSGKGKLQALIDEAEMSCVDLFMVGGSLLTKDNFNEVIDFLKERSQIPVVIFPGDRQQIYSKADGILLLSLISGRNPEFLIGQHVVAAPVLKDSGLEILPTGYMLVGDANNSSVAYVSNTLPIPSDKLDIAACTAMAGEQLGLKLIYLEAGSGAKRNITAEMIREVKKSISIPLIVGGGIKSGSDALSAYEAGADILVVGNGIQDDLELLQEVSSQRDLINDTLNVH